MSDTYHVALLEVPISQWDLLQHHLYEINYLGLEELGATEDVIRAKAYFLPAEDLRAIIEASIPYARILDFFTLGLSEIKAHQHRFEPLWFAERIWIMHPDEEILPEDHDKHPRLFLRPGSAFGTGRHETTELVARQLSQLCSHNTPASLLDVGCGSGILAILGLMWGIPHAEAVEIDRQSLRNARENAELMGFSFPIHQKLAHIKRPFDLVMANIVTSVLVPMAHELTQRVSRGGHLILSGITLDKEETLAIEQAYKHLRCCEHQVLGMWQSFTFQKEY
jgi:ribosomal protein L11 methyltransferase